MQILIKNYIANEFAMGICSQMLAVCSSQERYSEALQEPDSGWNHDVGEGGGPSSPIPFL